MDILDRAFQLPLRRPLADLATFGLVPEPASGDHGRSAWVAIAERRAAPTSLKTRTLVRVAFIEIGLTLETYLRDQLARLQAGWVAVAAVRLYLRGPGANKGSWTRAWMGVPRADMTEGEVNAHLQALLGQLSTRADLAGLEMRGQPLRKPWTPKNHPRPSPRPLSWWQQEWAAPPARIADVRKST